MKLRKFLISTPIGLYIMAYLMLLNSGVSFHSIKHIYLLSGSVSTGIVMLMVMNMSNRSWHEKIYTLGSLESKISLLGCLGAIMLFITSMIVYSEGLVLSSSDKISIGSNTILAFSIYANILLSLATLLCFFTIWTRYRVSEGVMAIVGEKIYYPGEVFHYFPTSNLSIRKLDNNFSLHFDSMTMFCKDGTFKGSADTTIALDIEKAKERGLRQIPFLELIHEIRKKVGEHICVLAAESTIGQLMQTGAYYGSWDIMQIPVSLKGVTKFTFEQKTES